MTEKRRNEMRNTQPPVPDFLEVAGDNMQDLFSKKYGCKGFTEKDLVLTRLGVSLTLRNRHGQKYSVLISDTDDIDVLRRRIVTMADGIRENFPEILETQ